MTVLEQNIKEQAILRKQPFFEFLSDADYQRIQTHVYSRSYRKGQVLFDDGDERNKMFFLKKGLVKFEKIDISGTFFYLDFAKAGELFPFTGLFTDTQYYFSTIALTDIEVYYVPMKILEDVIQNNIQQLLVYMSYLSEILKQKNLKIQYCVSSSAFDRVKNTLSLLMSHLGERDYFGNIVIPYNILVNDISKSSGTTRETTSSVIKKLVKDKKIKYIHKEFTFYDVNYFKLDFD